MDRKQQAAQLRAALASATSPAERARIMAEETERRNAQRAEAAEHVHVPEDVEARRRLADNRTTMTTTKRNALRHMTGFIRRYIVHAEWHPGYRPRFSVRRAPRPGDRVRDGGEVGTIIACPSCSGSGLLFESDELRDHV